MNFQESLKNYVNSNPQLVTKRSIGLDLYLLKYKNQVFFKNAFNQFLEECRGTIVDRDFNLVSYPFKKIYNYGIESRAPRIPLSTTVTAYRKINGFFAAATWHNKDLLVSTTGTIDSEFAHMAREHLGDSVTEECKQNPNFTYLFEICDPRDPHIIMEAPGAYYLGRREKVWRSLLDHSNLETIGTRINCFTPDKFECSLRELMDQVKIVPHEGFVWFTNSGISAKIKSPFYLVQKALARKKDILSLNKKIIPEEYYPLVDHLLEINSEFSLLTEQERLSYIRNYLSEQ